jgi:hypothetical protein
MLRRVARALGAQVRVVFEANETSRVAEQSSRYRTKRKNS